MKFAIQGASGYLGQRLSKYFLKKGIQIVGVTRGFRESASGGNDVQWLNISRIACEKVAQELIMNTDVFINVATCYGRNNESFKEIRFANIDNPLKVLKDAHEYGGIKTYIYSGSVLPPLINDYSATKHEFTAEAKQYCGKHGIKFINIVTDQICGPGNKIRNFVDNLIDKCLDPEVTKIDMTAGEQVRDFLYVDDLVHAYDIVINNIHKLNLCEHIEVGSNSPLTLRSFANYVAAKTQAKPKLHFGVIPYRKNELMRVELDSNKIIGMGWRQTTKLDEMLRLMIEDRLNYLR